MTKSDMGLIQPSDIRQALALLTRLPVQAGPDDRGGAAAWAYPLAGLVVGGIAALAGLLALLLGLPNAIAALICVAIPPLLTGALHEDGLADTADGLWGGWSREKRLEIMKDSHIGTYGVLALILSIAARWGALWLLFDIGAGAAAASLVAAAALSRATMPSLMASLPHARASGLSHSVGTASRATAALAWAIAAVLALFLTGSSAFGAAASTS